MANEIQTAPNTTPTTDADWAAELNLRELSMKGYDGISLTEWAAGNTDKPQIAAGSVIEIDGAIAKFTNQTALTDEGGLADGWCYIKFVVSGANVTPTLTNTFGTWDTAKQGFYDGGDRYSLHAMYRSGAVTKIFRAKSEMPAELAKLGRKRKEWPFAGNTNASTIAEITLESGLSAEVVEVYGSVLNATNYSGVDWWIASSTTDAMEVRFNVTNGVQAYSVIVVLED